MHTFTMTCGKNYDIQFHAEYANIVEFKLQASFAMHATRQILVSGIQPSGKLNIGNYIGAIRNWVELQTKYNCLFFLADLHAITVRQDPKILAEQCYATLALYLACGINPEQNIIFCQSHIAAHTQLSWILNCYAAMGELNRMTQFKDKAQKTTNINVGLFSYPILQAADILLYQAAVVPIGHDQKQHLELARNLAIRFNNIYGNIFTVPEPIIPKIGARIMALQNPLQKMSKSDPNEKNVIFLLDPPELINKKLKRAVTDSGTKIKSQKDKPGVSNLLTIYSAVSGKTIAELEQELAGLGYGKLKTTTAEAVIEFLLPIQKKFQQLIGDKPYLQQILRQSAIKAREIGELTLQKVYKAIGFIME